MLFIIPYKCQQKLFLNILLIYQCDQRSIEYSLHLYFSLFLLIKDIDFTIKIYRINSLQIYLQNNMKMDETVFSDI